MSTSLAVNANPGFYWTGADLPYDIVVGTEQMTVTGGTARPVPNADGCSRVNGTYRYRAQLRRQVNIANEIVLGY